MYSMHVAPDDMHEPHWHPNACEMGYVMAGRGRVSILDSNGKLRTHDLKGGDVYFVPRAYPHHLETVGSETLKLLSFFDKSDRGDIGSVTKASGHAGNEFGVIAVEFGSLRREIPLAMLDHDHPLLVRRIDPVKH